MSQWRHEASKRLPELQKTIASASVHTPRDLWTELWRKFDDIVREKPPRIDLLERIWHYGRWCLNHKDDSVQSAAIYFFMSIEDTRLYREVLPQFMSPEEYKQSTLR